MLHLINDGYGNYVFEQMTVMTLWQNMAIVTIFWTICKESAVPVNDTDHRTSQFDLTSCGW